MAAGGGRAVGLASRGAVAGWAGGYRAAIHRQVIVVSSPRSPAARRNGRMSWRSVTSMREDWARWHTKSRASSRGGKGEAVTVTTIVVPDPGPGEALVRVQACGVCHTDLHYREGGIGEDFPYLLGHEAAGVVEAVGEDVTGLAPGDFVILNWRAVCGQCRACRRGRPWYCFATHNATQKMTLADGTVLSPALGIGAFAEKTLVAAGPVHQGQPGGPARGGGAAGLRGDGRAGRGDQHRRGQPRRLGGGDRLRRGRRRGGDGRPAGGRADDHRGGRGRPEAGAGPARSARRTRSTPARPTRWRRSAS